MKKGKAIEKLLKENRDIRKKLDEERFLRETAEVQHLELADRLQKIIAAAAEVKSVTDRTNFMRISPEIHAGGNSLYCLSEDPRIVVDALIKELRPGRLRPEAWADQEIS